MENKSYETEEELRARLKEELKAELLQELKDEEKKKSKPAPPPVFEPSIATVKFDSYNDRGVKDIVELSNRDKTFGKNDAPKQSLRFPKPSDEDTGKLNLGLVLAILILIVGSYFALPKIFVALSSGKENPQQTPSKPDTPEQPVVELEDITLQSAVIKTLTYPIMRNNPYSASTYYNKSELFVSDFTNNDLLYNSFVQIYKGNIAEYTGTYGEGACVNGKNKKVVNAKYIDARMDNIFSKSTKFKHSNFKIPSTNETTEYVGIWKYDAINHQYIYYGDCNPTQPSKIRFYDLMIAYDAKGIEKNSKIEVYYNVAFAKVDSTTNKYEIYSDPAMKNQVLNGTLTTRDAKSELDSIFSAYIIDGNTAGKYKYTFSNVDCSYQDYCFEKGEFIAGV